MESSSEMALSSGNRLPVNLSNVVSSNAMRQQIFRGLEPRVSFDRFRKLAEESTDALDAVIVVRRNFRRATPKWLLVASYVLASAWRPA
jgi:hypothetical protein